MTTRTKAPPIDEVVEMLRKGLWHFGLRDFAVRWEALPGQRVVVVTVRYTYLGMQQEASIPLNTGLGWRETKQVLSKLLDTIVAHIKPRIALRPDGFR